MTQAPMRDNTKEAIDAMMPFERRQGGHLDLTLGKILAEIENLKKDVEVLTHQVDDLNDMKNKSIGAGFILAIVGSAVGWFINVAVDKLYK